MNSMQRKLMNNLFISGTAFIAATLLDVVKLVLYWILDSNQLYTLERLLTGNTMPEGGFVSVLVSVTIIDLIIALFIGLSARAEAKGKKKGKFYVIVAIILAAILGISTIFTLIEPFFSTISALSIIEAIISAGLSAVVVYALIDVAYCAIKSRKMQEKNKDMEAKA